ncbi:CcdB antidote-like protein [Deltaproteobacteria bacterium]|nr:CcdB antidote-like protein [Deltaproteobacteria bacterium]
MYGLQIDRHAHIMRTEVRVHYDLNAARRPVNLSLNEDLVRKLRKVTDNLSAQVERLLSAYLAEEEAKRLDAEARLARAVEGWNAFGERVGSFADEHSTL